MRTCIKCGRTLEDFDVGGDMICMDCEAAGRGYGSGTDVPCQRCGMYLPPHELKMWNSRLYCNYCIMDIQDEERMMQAGRKGERQEGNLPEGIGKSAGTCEKCGRHSEVLYAIGGRRLCLQCAQGEGGIPPQAGPAKPALLARVLSNAGKMVRAKLFGKGEQPVQAQPVMVFDIRTRRLVAKKDALHSQAPLEERQQGEKAGKPSKNSRDSFFGFLAEKKKPG